MRAYSLRSLWIPVAAVLLSTGCGDSDPVTPEFPLQGLVGDWNATSLTLSSTTNPPEVIDAIELGAEFFINVQESGGYTSSLRFQGFSTADVGVLEVDGSKLIFHVQQSLTGPRVDTADFDLTGDTWEIGGATVFDFDGDGISENAELEAILQREGGS